jgi:hypothetical protein
MRTVKHEPKPFRPSLEAATGAKTRSQPQENIIPHFNHLPIVPVSYAITGC